MTETKPVTKSLTIWGALVIVLAQVATAFGYTVTEEDQQVLVTVAAAIADTVGILMVVVGRIRATKQLGTAKLLDNGDRTSDVRSSALVGVGAIGLVLLLAACEFTGPATGPNSPACAAARQHVKNLIAQNAPFWRINNALIAEAIACTEPLPGHLAPKAPPAG